MCVCACTKLTTSECVLQGVFLTFASWPVLMEELMRVCVWTNRIPRAGRAVCVGEFCSCSFCVSESEPFAPAPGGHPQVRLLPRWASWWACSHPQCSWVAGRGSSTRMQACVWKSKWEHEGKQATLKPNPSFPSKVLNAKFWIKRFESPFKINKS